MHIKDNSALTFFRSMNPFVNGITIEHMTQKEVNVAIEWARREGWNPGVHDAECFYQADPDGFWAAKLNGEIVGTISLVRYQRDFVFEGLYIVKPEFRNRGIGLQIQNFALELCKGINFGLDGVVSMRQKYIQYGLKFAHINTRYSGTAQDNPSKQCQPIKRKDFSEIATFDAECFGFDRSRFLDCWLFQEDSVSLLIHNTKTGEISGYGVIRKCIQGHKIGPLFASTMNDAECLFKDLKSTVPNENIFIDVPQPNLAAVNLTQKEHLQPVFSTVRMYAKTAPKIPITRIFGITTFELG